MTSAEDSFSRYDKVLEGADLESSPWENGIYVPDWDIARRLLAIPVAAGQAQSQQSGAAAKAFDCWIAHELRRAGFSKNAVWPRLRRPRVLPDDLSDLEEKIDGLNRLVDVEEELTGERMKPASIRRAIKALGRSLPGKSASYILGRFYEKQVDVVVSNWQHGPDVLVSTKTAFSSYANNRINRYEEALGEAPNLGDRYPLAAIGFAFLVRSNIYDESGHFELLRDLLLRLRKPDGPFDATMLLVAEWEDATLQLSDIDEPAEQLRGSLFFEDIINAALTATPVSVHPEVRLRRNWSPKGGVPSAWEDA